MVTHADLVLARELIRHERSGREPGTATVWRRARRLATERERERLSALDVIDQAIDELRRDTVRGGR